MENFLAVAITRKRLNVGIISSEGEIKAYQYVYYDEIPDEKDLENTIQKMAKDMMREYEPKLCGVAAPHIVDVRNGEWYYGLSNVSRPIRSGLEKRLGIPVFVDNDINMAAFGEKFFGSMIYIDNFFYLSVSYGVGGAVFINGHIYRGEHNGAGEIGHIMIEEDGLPCSCGSNGCLETIVASQAISDYFGMLTSNANPPIYKDIAVLARGGDTNALDTYKRVGESLGKAISYVLNFLNVSRIVIGGTVGMEFDLLYPSIMEVVDKHALKKTNYDCIISKVELGYDAALIGCGAYCCWLENNPKEFFALSGKNL